MGTWVIHERVGPVAVVTLDRAQRHNSLVPEFLAEILAALEEVRAGSSARAMVLQANGRSFSTGGDVREFHAHLADLEAYGREIVGLLNRVIVALVDLPLPVVTAVHGIVTGGSLGLVLGSDVVLVAPEASFTPYYGVVGFSPDGGWTAMLPAIIGPQRAAGILLGNQTISASQAVAWGLASRIVPGERLRDEAMWMAKKIAALKPGSAVHTKRLLRPAYGDLAGRLEAERTRFVAQLGTEEARQGIVAFLEARRR
ncbi:MAG: enoyl-CoA hydratase/isomerase family protein [Anaerolineae bacterium]|jgi:enoyl-CoA hydratase/carnithine racemase